jgi:hypothetical protein
VLELGHVALEHFPGLAEGVGVLGLEDEATSLNEAVDRAAAPFVFRTIEALPRASDSFPGDLLKPCAVEGFGPAADHHG